MYEIPRRRSSSPSSYRDGMTRVSNKTNQEKTVSKKFAITIGIG